MSSLWMKNAIPSSYEDYVDQRPEMTRMFESYLRSRQIPHFLFVGHKGIGKTTFAINLAEAILFERVNLRVIFADDPITKEERSEATKMGAISSHKLGSHAENSHLNPFIHIKIMPFASSVPFGRDAFKILIIKNFDRLGNEQQAFRRIMEQYSTHCRIFIITSRISSIIDPILSRCSVYSFQSLSDAEFDTYLTSKIQENISSFEDPAAIAFLRKISQKNIGYALSIAQQAYEKFKMLSIRSLESYAENPKEKALNYILQLTFRKQLNQAFSQLQAFMKSNYITLAEFFTFAIEYVFNLQEKDALKQAIIQYTAKFDVDTVYNSDKYLVIRAYLMQISQFICTYT